MKNFIHAMKITCVSSGMLALMTGGIAHAQTQGRAKVFTCVDAAGRTLSSDRPIPQCIDRPQRILDGVTGHLQGIQQPSYTKSELDAIERQKAREQAEQRAAKDRRQYERGLVARYPNEAVHNAARVDAKATLLSIIASAQLRSDYLQEQLAKLNRELEFYGNDIAKAPASLKRQFGQNQQEALEQQRFMDGKRIELERIDRQFDAELVELEKLW